MSYFSIIQINCHNMTSLLKCSITAQAFFRAHFLNQNSKHLINVCIPATCTCTFKDFVFHISHHNHGDNASVFVGGISGVLQGGSFQHGHVNNQHLLQMNEVNLKA